MYDRDLRVSLIHPGVCRSAVVPSATENVGNKTEDGLCPDVVAERMLAAVFYNDTEVEIFNDTHMSVWAWLCRASVVAHRYFPLASFRKSGAR